ncbi:L,D-transpeptidase family protein [Opitutales bacterium ASA1]|uniref:L,D-transpeptidase family protein n=1 Tax=Congregicoccus parvus TaxID=3081749 RepID=UPI002B2AE96E|nr:L,D-transpeptidase family protein [Opitutales bacterium ASA1]
MKALSYAFLFALLASGAPRSAVAQAPTATAQADILPAETRQLVVCLTADWNTHRATLLCYERTDTGTWTAVGEPRPALLGKHGLAWGRGIVPVPPDTTAPTKQEGDGRSPAGVFAVGRIFGSDPTLPAGGDFPYRQVTAADAWIDDPENPLYNQHVVVPDPRRAPAWFESQRMRLGDPAFRWLVEIRHNAEPPLPGAGSAIFLHIRRGEDRPTAGCTAMASDDVKALVVWLRSAARPHFVALPIVEYRANWREWGLPPPESAWLPSP